MLVPASAGSTNVVSAAPKRPNGSHSPGGTSPVLLSGSTEVIVVGSDASVTVVLGVVVVDSVVLVGAVVLVGLESVPDVAPSVCADASSPPGHAVHARITKNGVCFIVRTCSRSR